MLIGGAAVLLFLISGIVLVALKPPSLRVAGPQELFNVDHKPITDALSKLPASYDGVRPDKKADAGKQTVRRGCRSGVPAPTGAIRSPRPSAPRRPASRAWPARPARSGVFFRLQLKAAAEGDADDGRAPRSVLHAATQSATDGGLATLSALRAAERALALAGGDTRCSGRQHTSDQTRKLTFLKSGPEKEIYNPHGLQTPVSPYQLMAGTVIAASLVTGLNSDLPGFVIAQVTEHVYDTVSGRHLLIPQGSRLVGKYDNIVAFGQERALVVWQRIILPDGSSIVIDNLPATDTGGYAGLADEVDLHTWKLLKGVALATVLGVGSELAFGSSRQRPRQGAAAVDAGDHQPRRTAPDRAQAQRAADHHRAPRLAAARHRAQGHRAAALPRHRLELSNRQGGPPHARHRNLLGRQGRLRRHHPHAHPERQGAASSPTTARRADGAPDFRISPGTAEIGAAWRKTKQGTDETYLRVRLDDPGLAAADLGRADRGDRGRRRAPDLAARPEGRRLRH